MIHDDTSYDKMIITIGALTPEVWTVSENKLYKDMSRTIQLELDTNTNRYNDSVHYYTFRGARADSNSYNFWAGDGDRILMNDTTQITKFIWAMHGSDSGQHHHPKIYTPPAPQKKSSPPPSPQQEEPETDYFWGWGRVIAIIIALLFVYYFYKRLHKKTIPPLNAS